MRSRTLRSLLSLTLIAAACESATAPAPLDPAGVQADLSAASSAVSAPATVSLGALGPQIGLALDGAGGALGMADLPAALLKDPNALTAGAERGARVLGGGTASVIPQAALGKTFEYDAELERYAAGQRAGAPANGVRFVLYAVDPITDALVFPLVETGYVDLTRSVTNQALTARVEAYSGGQAPAKVLDYAVSVQGTITNPTVIVAGFARNGVDSLTFTLNSTVSLATSTIAIDWRTALPSRGLSSRVEQTITGGEVPQVVIDGLLESQSGRVGITGTIAAQSGGTLTVKVNGSTFATITVDGPEDETPTILNAQGQPPTPAEAAMLRQILGWFQAAFETYEDLLDPVDRLLDLTF